MNVEIQDEQEHFIKVLLELAKLVEGEKIAFNLYEELYEDGQHDEINYGHKQLEISAFELEHAIRKNKDNNHDFALMYTDDRLDNERSNYCPDFIDESIHCYVDAKLHCTADNKAILNDEHAMKYVIKKDGRMYVLVAGATYTPDDGTYRAYRELRNGGKSKYQQKNQNSNHRMIKAATTINQLAIYRLDEDLLANSDVISIMSQGRNSNGNSRNKKLILDLTAIKPIAAIKAETASDGTITWNKCNSFDISLCGERPASEMLIAKNKQIQKEMNISPDLFKIAKHIKKRKYCTNENGETQIWIDSYTKTDGTKVKGHWRTISFVL